MYKPGTNGYSSVLQCFTCVHNTHTHIYANTEIKGQREWEQEGERKREGKAF